MLTLCVVCSIKAPNGVGQWLTIELHSTAPIAMPILTPNGDFKDEIEKPANVTVDDMEPAKNFKDRYSPNTSSNTSSNEGYLADLTSTIRRTNFRHASPFFFNQPRYWLQTLLYTSFLLPDPNHVMMFERSCRGKVCLSIQGQYLIGALYLG